MIELDTTPDLVPDDQQPTTLLERARSEYARVAELHETARRNSIERKKASAILDLVTMMKSNLHTVVAPASVEYNEDRGAWIDLDGVEFYVRTDRLGRRELRAAMTCDDEHCVNRRLSPALDSPYTLGSFLAGHFGGEHTHFYGED